MMSGFWKGKTVLVSGAMGMVGGRLCRFLRDVGANVYGLDNQSRGTHRVAGCNYDVCDVGEMAEWMRVLAYRFIKPDVIFNLAAACGGVYFNQDNQYSQFVDNVRLQSTPVRVAAEKRVPVFVQVSSVCVYASGFNDPAREESGHFAQPEAANAGYSWAKRMGEHICEWALDSDVTRWMVVRPTNMWGVRDYFDERAHVIPALIKKCLTKTNFTVWGGGQKREFLYADDGALGMMAVAEHGISGEAYNLGTDGETQVAIGKLFEMIYNLTGSKSDVTIDYNTETGDKSRSTDSSKIHSLGWKYKTDLWRGLANVINWYRSQ